MGHAITIRIQGMSAMSSCPDRRLLVRPNDSGRAERGGVRTGWLRQLPPPLQTFDRSRQLPKTCPLFIKLQYGSVRPDLGLCSHSRWPLGTTAFAKTRH